eukprot:scaffold2917_cov191-Amphora_coffeaeformis.AAC.15
MLRSTFRIYTKDASSRWQKRHNSRFQIIRSFQGCRHNCPEVAGRRRRAGTLLRQSPSAFTMLQHPSPLYFYETPTLRQCWHSTLSLSGSNEPTSTSAHITALLERTKSMTASTNATNAIDTQQLKELLTEWKDAFKKSSTHQDVEAAFPVVDALYSAWCTEHSFPPSSFSSDKKGHSALSESQAPVLPLWLEVHAQLGAGPTALEILQGWTLCFGSHLEWQPERRHYDTVLRAYAVGGGDGNFPEGPEVAQEILQLLQEFSFTMEPVATTYLWALQCIAKEYHSDDAGILEQTLQLAEPVVLQDSQLRAIPTSLWMDTLHAVFTAAREQRLDGPTLMPWLEFWTDLLTRREIIDWIETNHSRAVPEIRMALKNGFALSLAHPDRRTSAEEMSRILEAAEDLQDRIKPAMTDLLRPSDYVLVIQAWQSLSAACDVNVLEDLLHRLKKRHQRRRGNMTKIEARESYQALMQAFMAVGDYREVLQVYRDMKSNQIPWNTLQFTTVLEAAAEARVGHLAESAIRMMRHTIQAQNRHVKLESRHFSLLFKALLDSNHRQAANMGSEVFQWLLKAADEENSKVRVAEEHYASYVTLLGRSGKTKAAETIMNLMDSIRKDHGFEPSDAMHAALVTALGRKSSVQAAKQAQQLWDDLSSRGKADVRAYVAVMYAWMNSGHQDAIKYVEETFAKLLSDADFNGNLKPNRAAYRALLEAWAKEGRKEGAARALEIVEAVETKVKRGSIAEEGPDARFYTAAMRAIWKSKIMDSHIVVQSVYDRLVAASEANPHDIELKPDTAAMTVVLQAWASSIDPHKAREVWKMWRDMVVQFEKGNLLMKPTAVAAAAVLHACAYTTAEKGNEVRLDAVEIALELWQDIQEHNLLNGILVKQLLRVLGRHVEDYDERVRLATVAFQHACVVGCVTPDVVDALHTFVPTLYKQLPTDANEKVALPRQWTRNAKE